MELYNICERKLNKPRVGDTYIHKNKGGKYVISEVLPIKIEGVWIEDGLTVYKSLTDGKKWSRLTESFLIKFKKDGE